MYQDLNNWIMLSIDEQDVFINKDFLEFNYDLSKAVTYSSSDTSSGQNNGSSGKGSIYSKLVAYAMKFLETNMSGEVQASQTEQTAQVLP